MPKACTHGTPTKASSKQMKVSPASKTPVRKPRAKTEKKQVVRGYGNRGPRTTSEWLLKTAKEASRKLNFDEEDEEENKYDIGPVGDVANYKMSKLKEDIYGTCAPREMGCKATCSKWMLEPTVEQMIRAANITAKDKFLDLGSADGHLVYSMATRTGCQALGVELTRHNHTVALEALPKFKKAWAKMSRKECSVEFVNTDLRKFLPGREMEFSVVWIANLLMPIEVDAFLMRILQNFAPGTRIMAMRDLVPHHRPDREQQAEDLKWFNCQDLQWPVGGVEWDDCQDTYYLYTRTSYMG